LVIFVEKLIKFNFSGELTFWYHKNCPITEFDSTINLNSGKWGTGFNFLADIPDYSKKVSKVKKHNPGKRPNTIDHVFTQPIVIIRRHIETNCVLKFKYGR
jgi:uncharacterized short protein YbdD (DUF466 family)